MLPDVIVLSEPSVDDDLRPLCPPPAPGGFFFMMAQCTVTPCWLG